MPLTARAVDRLEDQLVQLAEHASARPRGAHRLAEERVHVVEERLLTEVVADHRRHVGVDGLSSATPLPTALAMETSPDRAALTSPGQPITESRRKCQRVEEVVVDPAVDDVDRPRPCRRTDIARRSPLDDQVAALDQLDAHLAGEQGVLEVGGVGDARGEHARPLGELPRPAARRQPQRVEEQGRVAVRPA